MGVAILDVIRVQNFGGKSVKYTSCAYVYMYNCTYIYLMVGHVQLAMFPKIWAGGAGRWVLCWIQFEITSNARTATPFVHDLRLY